MKFAVDMQTVENQYHKLCIVFIPIDNDLYFFNNIRCKTDRGSGANEQSAESADEETDER